MTVSIVGSDGTVLASHSTTVKGSSHTDWKQFTATLTPSKTASDFNNKFQVTLDGPSASGETMYFSMFSLFPPTFKNRPNGMRMDIAQVCMNSELFTPLLLLILVKGDR